MLNFRKLRQDFSPAHLKDGKKLFEDEAVVSAKIVELSTHQVRLSASVDSGYEHSYSCELEIDLNDSTTVDSDCNCPEHYDCQHLAALLFYMEKSYDELVVRFSEEADIDKNQGLDDESKESLLATFKEAETKEEQRREELIQKELLEQYNKAAKTLGLSPFFATEAVQERDLAELCLLFTLPQQGLHFNKSEVELQLAIRPPYRNKLILISNIAEFLAAIRYEEPVYVGNRRFVFRLESFEEGNRIILQSLIDFAEVQSNKNDKSLRFASMPVEHFGNLLHRLYLHVMGHKRSSLLSNDEEGSYITLPSIMQTNQEEPLKLALRPARFKFSIQYMQSPSEMLLTTPSLYLNEEEPVGLEQLHWLTSSLPGLIYQNCYWRFDEQIKRKHLSHLIELRDLAVPKPLFGAFLENSLPELARYGEVINQSATEGYVTIPYAHELRGECQITYLDGELEAKLFFIYNEQQIPIAPLHLRLEHLDSFIGKEGILARNLVEEQKIIEELFRGFVYDPHLGAYQAKSEKKIIEFMTEVIPRYKDTIHFDCPDNLLEKFIYDDTQFTLTFKEAEKVDSFEVSLKVEGALEGCTLDQLWDCISAKRAYLPLYFKGSGGQKKRGAANKNYKILILDLEKITPVVQFLDEIGIQDLTTHKEMRPLWTLATLQLTGERLAPIKITVAKKLKLLQEQMQGKKATKSSPIPAQIQAKLREYQIEGVEWLEKLRTMYLSGILADDMGLGKTLQAIIAITQYKEHYPQAKSLVVAPTSLLYNWQEEVAKFNPKLTVLVVDGIPQQRRKLISQIADHDVVITSYSLLQKDIEDYEKFNFHYVILDEAQQIKNKSTRNAKSVKRLQAQHKLILTGTPIENCLDELWSLFDFLMPGLLSSYDRFVEKYVRPHKQGESGSLENLRRKVAPFILRRMKKDVLSELPPITEVVYHCHLTDVQRELYQSYAASAREELTQLVEREGFDKVQIHVLATLTRLKQICCHPAIFAKEKRERGDSAKYEMLLELLDTLIEGGHKTVIFSQYTRMLNIMREDLIDRGINFEYLDGSSKDRLSIVKRFNENPDIPVFLVSLKAGGVGLNLTGADTIIHYDMWYNPAVESQARDRVHRMGQQQNVTSIKLVTQETIEERIVTLHNSKKKLVEKLIDCDDEAMGKLTWQEVLELLQI